VGTYSIAASKVFLDRNNNYNETVDVWSLGSLMYEVLSGKLLLSLIEMFSILNVKELDQIPISLDF
jgi:serine/threonine protein kinase